MRHDFLSQMSKFLSWDRKQRTEREVVECACLLPSACLCRTSHKWIHSCCSPEPPRPQGHLSLCYLSSGSHWPPWPSWRTEIQNKAIDNATLPVSLRAPGHGSLYLTGSWGIGAVQEATTFTHWRRYAAAPPGLSMVSYLENALLRCTTLSQYTCLTLTL